MTAIAGALISLLRFHSPLPLYLLHKAPAAQAQHLLGSSFPLPAPSNKPTTAAAMWAHLGGGRSMTLSDYYRHRALFPEFPAAVPLPAAVGDTADPSSDVEDPPLDLPAAANPAPRRGGGRAPPPPVMAVDVPPPFMHARAGGGAAIAGGQFDFVAFEARHARRLGPTPVGVEKGPSWRQADTGDDEATSKEGGGALPEPEEVYDVLKAIPDLARGDLLRAYSALLRDDRQFRCLMALPRDMRKDWLLMEIRNMQQ